MNIHEYQTKELYRSYNIPVPDGRMAHSANQAKPRERNRL